MSGPLALVGGDAFGEDCTFDVELLEASGASRVVVLATAAAYENPQRRVDRAVRWFGDLGAEVVDPAVYTRPDALDPDKVAIVEGAPFIYLTGGSPMHLRSVLHGSPLWDAITEAFHAGGVLAGSGAGGDVMCDFMVDPRGGAFGVGLALLTKVAMIPRYDVWSEDKVKRTIRLAPAGLVVVGVPEQTALIREVDGSWRQAGRGQVSVFVDGEEATLADVPVEAP